MVDVPTRLLRDPNTSATALLKALERVVGEHVTWEPESIWMELERCGIDIPVECRAKISAGMTLRLIPGFYWDALIFEKTAVALEGHPANPEILEEPNPAWLAWAVVEAEIILKDPPAFEYEPRAYTGVVLARAGFVVAPDQLSFAQKALDRETVAGDYRNEIAARWSRLAKGDLHQLPLTETWEDVQLARLAAVELHVRARRTAMERELGLLA